MELKDLQLSKKPQGVTIIEGFPGFGLVATITTEFLTTHLDCELIGRFWFEDLPATIAIHDNKIINPVGVYYNKKHNLVIIHSISGATGIEWMAGDLINKIASELKAKEIISIEGVGSAAPEPETDHKMFFHCVDDAITKKISVVKEIKPLKEGIIIGVTSALMLDHIAPLLCLFAETYTSMPDSTAASKVIEVFDEYLGLDIDTKPLLEQAEKFEEKLKTIISQGADAEQQLEKKQLSYVG